MTARRIRKQKVEEKSKKKKGKKRGLHDDQNSLKEDGRKIPRLSHNMSCFPEVKDASNSQELSDEKEPPLRGDALLFRGKTEQLYIN